MSGRITVRPMALDDMPFLCRVYASTREEELMQVPWTATQKESFLQMQFEAQHHHYMEHYRDAAFGVILEDGLPVGRLYIARWPEEIRIVDISLLPEYRRRGIGSFLLRQILDEATANIDTLTELLVQQGLRRLLRDRTALVIAHRLSTIKGADLGTDDGRLVLDFNFAYHPSCVYDPRWVCPLAPPSNRLPVPVHAGERLTAG